MKYLKINNLIPLGGISDYKGLDISQFASGSQIYPQNENVAYIATTQDNITVNTDITEITEAAYNQIKSSQSSLIQSQEERISSLEVAMAQTLGM